MDPISTEISKLRSNHLLRDGNPCQDLLPPASISSKIYWQIWRHSFISTLRNYATNSFHRQSLTTTRPIWSSTSTAIMIRWIILNTERKKENHCRVSSDEHTGSRRKTDKKKTTGCQKCYTARAPGPDIKDSRILCKIIASCYPRLCKILHIHLYMLLDGTVALLWLYASCFLCTSLVLRLDYCTAS